MATTTDRPTAAELRAQKDARVAEERARLEAARERVQAEEEAAAETVAAANGHPGGLSPDAQDGLFDAIIENSELEEALEAREKVKASRAALNAKFKEADDKAKGIIAGLDLDVDAVVRVGRFRISRSSVAGRSVAFETESTERLTISPVD